MKFGSIAYLNLLPFIYYLKKRVRNTQEKQMLRYHQGVPSTINRLFLKRAIDAAFISSIKSQRCRCSNLGVVANGAVYSVLLLKSEQIFDSESDTSNMLSKVLGLSGQIIIGDKALKHYLNSQNGIDLSQVWKEKTNLPFVFARLCYNKGARRVLKLAKRFNKRAAKIPYYYLKKEAKKRGITTKELHWYLQHIHYTIGPKEEQSLKLFFKKAQRVKNS